MQFVRSRVTSFWLCAAARLFLCSVNAPAIQAQSSQLPTDSAPAAKFEVASIKPCKHDHSGGRGGKQGGDSGGRIGWDPGSVNEECQSVYNLIRDAYLAYPEGKPWSTGTREEPSSAATGLTNGGCTGCGRGGPPVSARLFNQEIKGSPAWVKSDRYTIDAKAERPTSPEMMRGPMMQALLEDRFKLRIHGESKQIPVYELTVAPGGPKLQPTQGANCITFSNFIASPQSTGPGAPPPQRICGGLSTNQNGGSDWWGTSIGNLCKNLSNNFLDRDVVDKTRISGLFDIHLDAQPVVLARDDAADGAASDGVPPGPRIIDRAATAHAFQVALLKLGLRLEPAKGAGVFLVIDHIERPSGN
jgi:uncharacterized protein (TIGR03435 family)